MGGCGKQIALRWFCEARRFEFLHDKWIPLKVGFKTYCGMVGIPQEEAEKYLAVGELKFQEVSQNMNLLCQIAVRNLPSKRISRDELQSLP